MTGAQFAGMKASVLTPAHQRQTVSQDFSNQESVPAPFGPLYV